MLYYDRIDVSERIDINKVPQKSDTNIRYRYTTGIF